MRPINSLHNTETVDEALELLDLNDNAALIAGGQSLTQMLKQRIVGPDVLVDISRVSELDYVEEDDNTVRIGAMTRHNDLADAELIRRELPSLVSMIENLGDEQIRNMGTAGGDIAQSDPSSDYPPLTVTLDAEYVVRSTSGRRTIPAEDFFLGHYENALEDGELLTEIVIPKHPDNRAAAYEKYSLRKGDFAIASVGCRVSMDDGVCENPRLFAGAVGPYPERLGDAESELDGSEPTDEVIERVAQRARDSVDPHSDPVNGSAEYKQRLVQSLTKSVVSRAVEEAGDVQ